MLEKERESSDVLPAASSQHVKPRAERRGREASKHSAEVSVCRTRERESDAHRRSHSIQQKVGAAVRLSQEQPSEEDEYSQNSDACAIDHRAAVQEKIERNGTREVLPRTTTTLVVLKASAYHTHTVVKSQRQRQSSFQTNDCIRRMAGFTARFVFDCCLIQCSVLRDSQTRC